VTARIFFGLSALAANLMAVTNTGAPASAHDSLPRLLAYVIPHVIAAQEHSASAQDGAPGVIYAENALDQLTPLWVIATFLAITVIVRRRQRIALRC
jgi:hypothetical protein